MSRKAIQQALNALGPEPPECCGCAAEWQIAITALREALAQQEQEPVAWACQFYKGKRLEVFSTEERASTYVKRSLENGADVRLIALYTHPAPAQKPLTDEQITAVGIGLPIDFTWQQFARAIESAHHIGEKMNQHTHLDRGQRISTLSAASSSEKCFQTDKSLMRLPRSTAAFQTPT